MLLAQLNLPKKDNNGKCVLKHINSLRLESAKKFGGLTISNCIGDWYNKGKLYSDDNIRIEISIEPKDKKEFITMCKKYGKLTKQLAIYVVINNKPRIINL